jgi:hypothetical protein
MMAADIASNIFDPNRPANPRNKPTLAFWMNYSDVPFRDELHAKAFNELVLWIQTTSVCLSSFVV